MALRKTFLSIIILISFAFFALYPSVLISSVSNSLILWYKGVFPTLFPFAMGISMLGETGFAEYLGKKLDFLVRVIFKVNGCGAFPLIMGLLAGYPTGAKITADLYAKKLITKEEAQCIMSFCNNPGPIFITATVGVSLMGSRRTGYIMLFSTVLSSIITGIIFSHIYPHKISNTAFMNKPRQSSAKSIGTVISDSIYTAAHILILIGGYIILFGIINSILKETGFLTPFGRNISLIISGLLEMTNGINAVCLTDMYTYEKAILSTFFLSFGGLAIQLQIAGFTGEIPINKTLFILSQIFKAFTAAIIMAVVIFF
ncbi:hypothetical protein NE664_06875 [Anaerotignum faecicola]|nr:hypothetical protein [Anaerotignum faecicola]